jgi:hypothetical protein
MADDHSTADEAQHAPDTSGTEPQTPPKPPVPAADPVAAARQALAEQRLAEVQGQLNALTQQNQAIAQQLTQRQQQEFERELAELSPAERAERRAQLTQQQVAYLANQISRTQAGHQAESQEAYFSRRSRELEAEYGIPIREVDPQVVQAGEAATKAWLKAEKERRAQQAPAASNDDKIQTAVAKALADAGVAGPVGGRAAASSGDVSLDDWKKVAWQGVGKGDRLQAAPGRSMGVNGMGQGKLKADLQALRDRAYREQGIGA